MKSSNQALFSRREVLGLSAAATGAILAPSVLMAAAKKPVVVVWSEGTAPKKVYSDDINGAIVVGLKDDLPGWEVVKAGIDDPEQGVPDGLLNRADVLIWWGHKRHNQVKDELVQKIVKRVKRDGMGFISLHSSHFAKPNKALMGTPCTWGAYIADTTTVKLVVKAPEHPIAQGLPKEYTFVHEERYSEPYAVPEPETVVFDGGHTTKSGQFDPARQGMCWQIGKGKFFYFQPGHESTSVFTDKNVRKILANAVKWSRA